MNRYVPTEADKILDQMDRQVRERVKKTGLRCKVRYAAYPCRAEPDDLPINNLGRVARKGKCKFIVEGCCFFGNGKGFRSRTVVDPTWLQLTVLANYAIYQTRDFHHEFFEGVRYRRTEHGVKVYEMFFGS